MSTNDTSKGASSRIGDDKCEVSTTVDSGFFSQEISSRDCSGLIEEHQQQQQSEPMRLDSGIDTLQLSRQLLSVHLDSSNDLGKEKNQLSVTTSSGFNQSQTDTNDEKSWEKYFDQDVNGDTCLHTAIMEGFFEAARILIKLAPHQMLLDTHNDEAQSPLHLAVLTQQWEIVRWLIVAGARSNSRNLCGDSPLHVAARKGDMNSCIAITKPVDKKEIEQLDLSYVPKSMNLNLEQWNYEGQTPLHVAAIYGHIDIMKHLLQIGADVNAREGKSGYTVLHIAIESRNDQMSRFLMSDWKNVNYEIYTYGGRSVLQLGQDLDYKLREVLQLQGVPSYISSEDEQDSESDIDDDGVMVDSQF